MKPTGDPKLGEDVLVFIRRRAAVRGELVQQPDLLPLGRLAGLA